MSARASQMPPKIKSITTSQLAALLKTAVRAHQTGHIEEAASGYRRILAINPHHPDALHLLGLLLHARGNHEQAVRLVTAALQAAPHTAAFHATLAAIQLAKGDTAGAIATARRAVELDPNLLAAGNTLGNAHLRAGDAEAAVAVYRQLLVRAPNSPETLNNLGSALQVLGENDEAACVLGRALAVKPDYAAAVANLALVRRDQGKLADALDACDSALQQQPDNPTWRTNRATLLLQMGRFREGWAEYEWRWRAEGFVRDADRSPLPRWDGSDPAGRTILLRGEQGLGSMIQFARYAPLLAAAGARVMLQCPAPLQRLFAASFLPPHGSLAAVFTPVELLPAVDAQVPLMSLPHLCRTTLANIPAAVPYLRAEPDAVALWDQRLGRDDHRPRVGLVWAGNSSHANDRHRSMPPEALLPLLTSAAARFVSLQEGREPPAVLDSAGLIDTSAMLTDFAATAAAVACLDLLISVDTAVAHLAGALAKPVWLLVPPVPEWRWLVDRDDSPWYPTMRLFRQSRLGDWNELIQRVSSALTAMAW